MNCTVCPRKCAVDRTLGLGFCHASRQVEVASVCVHTGEEPPLCGKKGICNVFFAHCNLQCVFCQNSDISRGEVDADRIFYHSMDEVVDRIAEVIAQTENVLGLVSPSHYAFAVPELIDRLHQRGLFPTVVYNTGGYDSVEMLRTLEPWVDVYLPDFKYIDPSLAARYSHAADYPEVAQAALREMVRQKGTGLLTDEDDVAFRGVIVRHLVLPGAVENSLGVLDWMADEISANLHISLMAQYFPPRQFDGDLAPLNRRLTLEEYQQVVDHFYEEGFHKGWVQELSASDNYHPDFNKQEAFERK